MLRTAFLSLSIGLALMSSAAADPILGQRPQEVADRMMPAPTGITVSVWASGLTIPWSLVFLPDGSALVSERRGRVLAIEKGGTVRPEPYATLSVVAAGEGGLMGLAVDPQFATRPYVYAMLTHRRDGQTVNAVVRLKHEGARGAVDRTILDGLPAGTIHNGGRIAFGPDGLLYVAIGDTGRPEAAADRSLLAGKILRITGDGVIPPGNPFSNSPVFSFGHRNVQGLAWRPGTRELYASEHGPSGEFGLHARDEINRIHEGGNYGWPAATCAVRNEAWVDPLVCWPERAVAPSGMTFFAGDLFLATLRGEALIRIRLGAEDQVESVERWFATAEQNGRYGRLRDAVVGPDEALYVLTNNGCGGQGPVAGDCILRLTAN